MSHKLDFEKIKAIKDRLTIPLIWIKFGLPGRPRRSCPSPFRKDGKPSFSVYDEDRRWKDFSTGEGGDVIDFIAKARGLSSTEGFKLFIDIAIKEGYDRY